MSWLRDAFSKIGVCESTADLALKPELVEQIIQSSMDKYGAPSDSEYKERFEMALSQATSYSLSRIIEEDVGVYMDRRLSNLAADFWGYQDIYSIFYSDGENKTMSLFDNGSKRPHGFLDPSITDHSGSSINELVSMILDKNKDAELVIGVTRFNAGTKTNTFRLENAAAGDRLFKRNPQLLRAPVAEYQDSNFAPKEPI